MKVVLCTPTLTRPHPAYLDALEASVPALDQAGFEHFTVFEIGRPYISHARAVMLRKALDAKADAIVFIDHDMSWRPEDLVTLIQTEGDVVAGTYRFRKDEEEYMGHVEENTDGTPAVRSNGTLIGIHVPAGFLKITPKCVDKFMAAYPELAWGPRYSPSIDLFNHGAHEGMWWGEDYAFARRWRACGGEIIVVPDLDLTHHSHDKEYPGNLHKALLRQKGGSEWKEAA